MNFLTIFQVASRITQDRLAGLEVETLTSGVPILKGGQAYFDCKVVQTVPAGTNTLFVAEVAAAQVNDDGQPLLYFDREYRLLPAGSATGIDVFSVGRGIEMEEDRLTQEEKQLLLGIARQALETGARGESMPPLDLKSLPQHLQTERASFVTLTEGGNLRGCIGVLEPYQPLAEDVREHAIAAALNDYRFPPVQPDELPNIVIEVSRLTIPVPLEYVGPDDLIDKLHPGVDGVVICDGWRRATFLPQVWEKIPDPAEFLDHLCAKMGAAPDLWRKKHLDVLTYQVEDFHE